MSRRPDGAASSALLLVEAPRGDRANVSGQEGKVEAPAEPWAEPRAARLPQGEAQRPARLSTALGQAGGGQMPSQTGAHRPVLGPSRSPCVPT